MRKVVVLAVGMVLAANVSVAQNGLRFSSTEWLGLTNGEAGSSGTIQTVNGVSKGPWFAGAGTGFDFYRYSSLPLFLSVTRDFRIGDRDRLYLYADGGTNFPLYKRPSFGGETSSFHSGEYWSGGLGYVWKLGDRTNKAMIFSLGYTVKKLSEKQTFESTCFMVDCNIVYYEYLNKVYQFMIGFRW